MSVEIIEPDGISPYVSNLAAVTGAASVNAALADDSDASYVRSLSTSASQFLGVTLAAMTALPAGDDILSVRPRLKYKCDKAGETPPSAALARKPALAEPLAVDNASKAQGATTETITTVVGAEAKLTPDGLPWTQARVNDLLLALTDPVVQGAALGGYLYEAEADVRTHARPAATPTVAATVATSLLPISLAIACVVEDAGSIAAEWECRVFDAAVYGGAGFDPASAPAIWESTGSCSLRYLDGVSTSTYTQALETTALADGLYRVYARAKWSAYPSATWGAWAYDDTTLATVAPTVSVPWFHPAVVDDAAQRVLLSVGVADGTGHTDATVDIERRADVIRDEFPTLEDTRWRAETVASGTVELAAGAVAGAAPGLPDAWAFWRRGTIDPLERRTFLVDLEVAAATWAETDRVMVLALMDVEDPPIMAGLQTAYELPGTAVSEATGYDQHGRLAIVIEGAIDKNALLTVRRAVPAGSGAGGYWNETSGAWQTAASQIELAADTLTGVLELSGVGYRIAVLVDGTPIADTGWQAWSAVREFYAPAALVLVAGEPIVDDYTGSAEISSYAEHLDVWESVRGAVDAEVVLGTLREFSDREAPRGQIVTYRARANALYSSVPVTSAWTEFESDTAIATAGWNLKVPEDRNLDMIDVDVKAHPSYTQEEDVGIFRPIDGREAIAVSSGVSGADGELTIRTKTESEWRQLEAVREYPGVLLLESPFGWSRYIKPVRRGWVETGTPAAPRRALQISYVEVEAP